MKQIVSTILLLGVFATACGHPKTTVTSSGAPPSTVAKDPTLPPGWTVENVKRPIKSKSSHYAPPSADARPAVTAEQAWHDYLAQSSDPQAATPKVDVTASLGTYTEDGADVSRKGNVPFSAKSRLVWILHWQNFFTSQDLPGGAAPTPGVSTPPTTADPGAWLQSTVLVDAMSGTVIVMDLEAPPVDDPSPPG